MKFTLSWLKEHLETDASVEELGETLTNIGLEIESIDNPAEKLSGYTVAYVKSTKPHPDADRLKVCEVETKDGTVQIVCGAPNCEAGMKAVLAKPGMYVPGIDVTLKVAKIRGEESHGMLCSAKEIEAGEESDGIIRLADDAVVGQLAAEALGLDDPVFEIGLTPNRADCTAVRGIARDLAAAGLGTLKPYEPKSDEDGFESSVKIKIEDTDGCYQFAGRLIRGVKNGESPAWLKARLTAIGLRPISMLVDITNYFTYALGRPLHVYDVSKLKGNIAVKASKGGEEFEALNDKSYTLGKNDCMICDDSGLVGLGGVVGGVSTGADENTTDVFVECALFNPLRIATTGRALQVLSDARYRFERGVDPESVMPGMLHATDMIMDLCGGEASKVELAGHAPEWQRTIEFDYDKIENLGGIQIDQKQAEEILTTLGFGVSGATITPPSFRGDIVGQADLVEEVLRIYGYDKVEPVSVTPSRYQTTTLTTAQTRSQMMKRELAGRGLLETVTWSFLSEKIAKVFGGGEEALTLLNPISEDLKIMRPSVLPNLIQAAQRNADKGYPNTCLFEVGPDFQEKGQRVVAAGIRTGKVNDKSWTEETRPVDLYDVKADVLAAVKVCGGPEGQISSSDAPTYYHPGRSATIRLGKNVMAQFGEIHPGVLQALGVDGPVVAFEVFLEAIPEARQKTTAKKALKLSALQPVHRDFAFVVTDDVQAAALERAAKGADKSLINRVHVFDVYQGEHLEDGKKSLAVTVTLQPKDATLTDEQIEAVSQKIIVQVEKDCGGTLRG